MSEGELPFKGVWIPAVIFNDERLSATSKFLWSVIHVLSNERGCFATKQTLGRYIGVTERHVYTNINSLEACGYIKVVNGVIWDCVTECLDTDGKFMLTMNKPSETPCTDVQTYSNKTKGTKKDKKEVVLDDSFIRSHSGLSKMWDEYIDWRKAKNKPVDNAYINRWNNEFKKAGPTDSVIAVTNSLYNGYQGIFIKSVAKPVARINTSEDHAKGF
jgi:hypothetical protein